jgi:hypothetical protein
MDCTIHAVRQQHDCFILKIGFDRLDRRFSEGAGRDLDTNESKLIHTLHGHSGIIGPDGRGARPLRTARSKARPIR